MEGSSRRTVVRNIGNLTADAATRVARALRKCVLIDTWRKLVSVYNRFDNGFQMARTIVPRSGRK
jgi:hypothetical protein